MNFLRKFAGSVSFIKLLISCLPSQLPLPSSARMYPRPKLFGFTFLPSYQAALVPLAQILTMPGLFLQQAIAAAAISCSTVTLANLKKPSRASCTTFLRSSEEAPAPKKVNTFYFFGVVYKVDVAVKQSGNVFLVVKIGVNGIGVKRGNSSPFVSQTPARIIRSAIYNRYHLYR
jgi:hypothetical protein